MEISGEVCVYESQICSIQVFVCVCVCVRECVGIAQCMHMKTTHPASLDLCEHAFGSNSRTSCSKTGLSAPECSGRGGGGGKFSQG